MIQSTRSNFLVSDIRNISLKKEKIAIYNIIKIIRIREKVEFRDILEGCN